MKRQEFFEKYRLNQHILRQAGLVWEELIGIKNAFEKTREQLNTDAKYLADRLCSFDRIHMVKTRIKNPEHLIEKIIRIKRKKKAPP